ncbi:MAG: pilus assembly PilX N-terminal domain-containing protein [Candidatus Magasanikbacteria bacterium]|nr:pilus assembly PilX N-terminal domain-containing protein [Candidatus Magasanikbacteria bacterium]
MFISKNLQLTSSLLKRTTRGSILLFVAIFGAISFTIIVLGVSGYAVFEQRASTSVYRRDKAFHIAEAGINYYRWHLAHNPTDYQDGTGEAGPYVHEYTDKDGNLVGYFSLEIDEPLVGSSVVTIRSTGYTLEQPHTTRTIQVRVGFPSLADYVFLENANMNFSFTTDVHGVVHSNGGIRFDGTTDSWVRSAKETYQYQSQTHTGVWGAGGPQSFWEYPVDRIDFDSLSVDLDAVMDLADLDSMHFLSSGNQGWHVVFASSTFNLYRVTSNDCYYGNGRWRRFWFQWYWDGDMYCYDIGNETFVATYNLPAHGALFFEDNVWIDGTVDGRVTIGVGRFPVQAPYKTAYINGNLVYAEKSSDDVMGIIAQGDIIVPYEVPDSMEINAGALSQFGAIYTPYYNPNENPNGLKDTLTFFGSQISYTGGGWKYVNGWGNVISGFEYTNHVYDGNLKYYPPPGFPVGSTYELISWEELE